jgi:hypothetical protein
VKKMRPPLFHLLIAALVETGNTLQSTLDLS